MAGLMEADPSRLTHSSRSSSLSSSSGNLGEKEDSSSPVLPTINSKTRKPGGSTDSLDLEEGVELVFDGNIVKGGTIYQLVKRIAWHKEVDTTGFITTFLLTYSSFTTGLQIIDVLEKIFNMTYEEEKQELNTKVYNLHTGIIKTSTEEEGGNNNNSNNSKNNNESLQNELTLSEFEKNQKITRLRIGSFIKTWLDKHPEDFVNDKQLFERLQDFLVQFKACNLESLYKQVSRSLDDLLLTNKNEYLVPAKLVNAPIPINPNSSNLLDFDPLELARQMTLLDSNLFKQITPKECVGQRWSKPDRHEKAPHLTSMIENFNVMSMWVAHEILKCLDKKKRVKTIVYFINVVEQLEALNNYNGIQEVIAALDLTPIWRLKATWAKMELRHKGLLAKLDEWRELMNLKSSYGAYRARLNKVTPPLIPYMGIHLHDLTHIEDGNTDYLNKDHNIINFDKKRKIGKIIYLFILSLFIYSFFYLIIFGTKIKII